MTAEHDEDTFEPGQAVRIVDGPFADFTGIIDAVNLGELKLRVLINFFGQPTPVTFDFSQVRRP